jgi:hypothetical protein
MVKETKYRPYLTLSEISRILEVLPEEDVALRKNLQLFYIKVTGGFVEGSYVSNPRKTLEERLEFDEASFMESLARREI